VPRHFTATATMISRIESGSAACVRLLGPYEALRLGVGGTRWVSLARHSLVVRVRTRPSLMGATRVRPHSGRVSRLQGGSVGRGEGLRFDRRQWGYLRLALRGGGEIRFD
jgi:hypothetical protein